MSPNQIKQLQHRITESDELALKELHAYFCARLYQTAIVIIRSRQMAEEIIEDVFIKLWEQRSRLPEVRDLKSYLYVITRNISLDYLRKTSGKKNYSLDEVSVPLLMAESTPEDQMISAEIIKKINLAINDLPPRCKLIFKLVKVDGLKHKEVAELLNINLKTVEAQMAIALKRLYGAVLLYLPSYAPKK